MNKISHTVTYRNLIAATTLVMMTTSGCASLKNMSAKKAKPSSNEVDASAGTSDSPQPPGDDREGEKQALTDEDAARLAIQIILGEADTVDRIAAATQGRSYGVAEGSFALNNKDEHKALELRALEFMAKTYAEDGYDFRANGGFEKRVCVENLRMQQQLDDETEAKCQNKRKSGRDAHAFVWTPTEMRVALDGLLPYVSPDDAQRAQVRFVEVIGAEQRGYANGAVDPHTRWGMQFVDVADDVWTKRQVDYALDYAQKNNLPDAAIASLNAKAKVARAFVCFQNTHQMFVEDFNGVGYQKLRATDDWMRFKNEEIDCADAENAPSDEKLLKLMKATADRLPQIDKFTAAKITGEPQIVKNRGGRIVRRAQQATIVWREHI